MLSNALFKSLAPGIGRQGPGNLVIWVYHWHPTRNVDVIKGKPNRGHVLWDILWKLNIVGRHLAVRKDPWSAPIQRPYMKRYISYIKIKGQEPSRAAIVIIIAVNRNMHRWQLKTFYFNRWLYLMYLLSRKNMIRYHDNCRLYQIMSRYVIFKNGYVDDFTHKTLT